MLTPDQEKWISHLSDQDQVQIYPFDPTTPEKFEAVLGRDVNVIHRGATSLGISGQDEIDIYVPVPEDQFEPLIAPLTAAFGSPRSHYPGDRARFVVYEEGKHVDVFLIVETCTSWVTGIKFENYIRSHPETMEQYRLLKEAGHGLSTREYYRLKTEFFNEVLLEADE